MIWKLIRRNVAGKPFRFFLTCSAVTAGVMFTVGVFVFTEGMRAEFAALAESIEGDTDLAVRTQIEFGEDSSRPPFDVEVADLVESIPGTTFVQSYVLQVGNITFADGSGTTQSSPGAGAVGLNWPDNSANPRLFLIDGRAPMGPGEFAIDTDAFADGDFEIGGRYDLTVPAGIETGYELVGTFNFGSPTVNELLGGVRQIAFETATAVELLNVGAGLDRVEFSLSPDADRAQVKADVAAAVAAVYGTTLEVVDGELILAEQEEEFDEIISVFRTVLLVFAIIILAVSAFVIYNVFTILIGQRIRELGLMRAIGATGRQVTQALLGEALMVGIASTAMGIVAGIGFGWGQGWLLSQLEFGPGNNNLVITSWTLVWGVVLGNGVTMASATVPALRARHLSPMAALREDARLTQVVPARNYLIGVPFVVIGWTLLIIGLSIGGDSSWPVWVVVPLFGFTAAFANAYGLRRIDAKLGRFAMLGFGGITIVLTVVLDLAVGELLLLLAVAAITLFLGVNAISPSLAQPVSNIIGRWPLAMLLGIGGVAIVVIGSLMTLGAAALVIFSLFTLITDFGAAGLLAVPGSLLLMAVGAAVLLLGVRAVDASFIMGWRTSEVIIGLVTFLVGAAGVIVILGGLTAPLSGDWGGLIGVPIGAVVAALAVVARRAWLPASMKSNARMARENAGRSPRRTASAAAALMIGVALVSTAAVVTESFKLTFADVLAERVISDFFISNENNFNPEAGFSRDLADDIASISEVESTISFRFVFEAFQLSTDGSTRDASAVSLTTSFDHFDPGFVEIDRGLVGPDSLWLHEDVADDAGLSVGDALAITFNDGTMEPVRLTAIYEDLAIFGSSVVDETLWDRHFPASQDQFLSIVLTDGADIGTAKAAIEDASDGYAVIVDTRDEFQDRQEGQIDAVLQIFTVLLLAAIMVALLGISITLALSVFERTRELGLVRAVGMTQQQMMRMVLFEGAIIAAFGGFLGVALGAVFGSAAVTVIPDTFISQLSVPVGLLVQYMALASVFGIGAAIIPARRAARLNVLDAISQE
jgi:ABC-type antimicrobial peptide transport system permease subunit